MMAEREKEKGRKMQRRDQLRQQKLVQDQQQKLLAMQEQLALLQEFRRAGEPRGGAPARHQSVPPLPQHREQEKQADKVRQKQQRKAAKRRAKALRELAATDEENLLEGEPDLNEWDDAAANIPESFANFTSKQDEGDLGDVAYDESGAPNSDQAESQWWQPPEPHDHSDGMLPQHQHQLSELAHKLRTCGPLALEEATSSPKAAVQDASVAQSGIPDCPSEMPPWARQLPTKTAPGELDDRNWYADGMPIVRPPDAATASRTEMWLSTFDKHKREAAAAWPQELPQEAGIEQSNKKFAVPDRRTALERYMEQQRLQQRVESENVPESPSKEKMALMAHMSPEEHQALEALEAEISAQADHDVGTYDAEPPHAVPTLDNARKIAAEALALACADGSLDVAIQRHQMSLDDEDAAAATQPEESGPIDSSLVLDIMNVARELSRNNQLSQTELCAFLGEGTESRFSGFLQWMMAERARNFQRWAKNRDGTISLLHLRGAAMEFVSEDLPNSPAQAASPAKRIDASISRREVDGNAVETDEASVPLQAFVNRSTVSSEIVEARRRRLEGATGLPVVLYTCGSKSGRPSRLCLDTTTMVLTAVPARGDSNNPSGSLLSVSLNGQALSILRGAEACEHLWGVDGVPLDLVAHADAVVAFLSHGSSTCVRFSSVAACDEVLHVLSDLATLMQPLPPQGQLEAAVATIEKGSPDDAAAAVAPVQEEQAVAEHASKDEAAKPADVLTEAEYASSEAAAGAALQALEKVKKELGTDTCICILGSRSFSHPDSETLVKMVARRFGESLNGSVCFVTGGQEGVQKTFARHCRGRSNLWNLVLEGQESGFSAGVDVTTCTDQEQLRQVLPLLGNVFVSFEGGPGSAQVMRSAFARGAHIIPVMRTGGASAGMFDLPMDILTRPSFATEEQWSLLADINATPLDTANALVGIIAGIMNSFEQAEQDVGTKVAKKLVESIDDSRPESSIGGSGLGMANSNISWPAAGSWSYMRNDSMDQTVSEQQDMENANRSWPVGKSWPYARLADDANEGSSGGDHCLVVDSPPTMRSAASSLSSFTGCTPTADLCRIVVASVTENVLDAAQKDGDDGNPSACVLGIPTVVDEVAAASIDAALTEAAAAAA
jgi:hypothetical protein